MGRDTSTDTGRVMVTQRTPNPVVVVIAIIIVMGVIVSEAGGWGFLVALLAMVLGVVAWVIYQTRRA